MLQKYAKLAPRKPGSNGGLSPLRNTSRPSTTGFGFLLRADQGTTRQIRKAGTSGLDLIGPVHPLLPTVRQQHRGRLRWYVPAESLHVGLGLHHEPSEAALERSQCEQSLCEKVGQKIRREQGPR